MAGLGDTCTHIASVLFYLEATARLHGTSKTCTQEACQWIIPSYLKEVGYLPIKDINFSSAWGKKWTLDDYIKALDAEKNAENDLASGSEKSKQIGTKSTESELALLFQKLSTGGTKPSVLSVIPNYSDVYVPKSSSKEFPPPLKSLKDTKYTEMEYHDLLTACELVSVDITEEMANSIEKATRDQSNSNLWFKYRAGRITASKMKVVCRTDAAKPAQSLIKGICYPETFTFKSKLQVGDVSMSRELGKFTFRLVKVSIMISQ